MNSSPRRFKSLRQFTRDGLWSSFCEGIAESNFSAFAVSLAAGTGQLAWLASLQQLAGAATQLWSDRLIGWLGSRKRLVCLCVSLQALMLGLMIQATWQQWSFVAFLGLVGVYGMCGSLCIPAWNSWVSDLLPARRRGTCFSIRNQRTHPASFIALILGGVLLDLFGARLGVQAAFCAIFALGLFAKLSSLKNLLQQQEFPFERSVSGPAGPVLLAQAAAAEPEFRRILIFFAAMGFAVSLSGPFQVPYLLKTLGYNYTQYTFLFGIMAIARFLSAPFFGRMVDRVGSRRLLSYSSVAMPLVPLGWCLTDGYVGLMFAFFLSGLVWAAFDLCAFTYLAETVVPAKRSRTFAARHVVWNLSAFLGSMAGAYLLHKQVGNLPPAGIGPRLAPVSLGVFWASALCRALACLTVLLLPRSLPTPAFVPLAEPAPSDPMDIPAKAA